MTFYSVKANYGEKIGGTYAKTCHRRPYPEKPIKLVQCRLILFLILVQFSTFIRFSFGFPVEVNALSRLSLAEKMRHRGPRKGLAFPFAFPARTYEYHNDNSCSRSRLSTKPVLSKSSGAMESEGSDTQLANYPVVLDPFLEKVRQLCEYKRVHGDLNVPRRYEPDPSLGHFVNKQRQLYHKYTANETCSLTSDRVEILNRIGFMWRATGFKATSTNATREENDSFWQHFEELSTFVQDKMNVMYDNNTKCYVDSDSLLQLNRSTASFKAFGEIPPKSVLGIWLSKQRKEYINWLADRPSAMDPQKVDALASLDNRWFLSPRERRFEINFLLLQAYKKKYGDTLIPISYCSKKLANWVSTQRKNYNLKMSGEKSDLTDERLQRLQSIGFVWNRWEYEFERRSLWN